MKENKKIEKSPPMVVKMKERLRENAKINLVDMKIPLSNGLETPRIKDILEENVDSKYYLKKEIVDKIVNEDDFRERLASIKSDEQKVTGDK